MEIIFRDGGGVVCAAVDGDGIDFADGKAYFTVDGTGDDYKIDINNIVAIHEGGVLIK